MRLIDADKLMDELKKRCQCEHRTDSCDESECEECPCLEVEWGDIVKVVAELVAEEEKWKLCAQQDNITYHAMMLCRACQLRESCEDCPLNGYASCVADVPYWSDALEGNLK